jgi:hypothetical protein
MENQERKELLTRLADDKLVWDIVLALRSSDNNDPGCELKWLTTARIRGIVCPSAGSKRFYDVNMYALTESDRKYRDELLAAREAEAREPSLRSYDHFAAHYKLAVEAIRQIYAYDLQDEANMGGKRGD